MGNLKWVMVYETTEINIPLTCTCITGWVWLEASWAFYAILVLLKEEYILP